MATNEETVTYLEAEFELGGWNIPEAITVEAQPGRVRDLSGFEL